MPGNTLLCQGSNTMLTTIIFFVAGIVLGLLSLRLLSLWEARVSTPEHDEIFRHHS